MPAPSADFPALGASTSSSGYSDGLGRRALAFDREDGTMLERLVVRAELSAFERSLRERFERIAAMDDERIAKPRSMERSVDGTLVVLSEFVPGSRLSDLVDVTAHQGTVPGLDVALGFLLDVLPALCGLHAGAGFAHGAISPGRTVLTPAGQVVLLDGIFGDALSRLHYSRQRLWLEFGLAMPPAAGPSRFDASCDIGQAALCAVMLMIGRPVAEDEYPDGIAALVAEVVEVAQIRGSSEFAAGLQRFLQRSLPLPGRRPYTAADDALIDVRDIARELGMDVCRRALVEFIEQQDTTGQPSLAFVPAGDAAGYTYEYAVGEEWTAESNNNGDSELAGDTDEDSLEIDLDLDGRSAQAEENETIYDLSEATEEEPVAREDDFVERDESAHAEGPVEAVLHPDAFVPPQPEPAPEPEPVAPEPVPFDPAPFLDEPVGQAAATETIAESTSSAPDTAAAESTSDEGADSAPAIEPVEPEAAAIEEPAPLTEESDEGEEAKHSRRRKRSRSARSRKDKLRSVARPQPLAPAKPPTPPPAPASPPPPAPPIAIAKPTTSGWLVEPNRAAAFEPPVAVPNVPAPPVAPMAPRSAPIALAPQPPAPPPAAAPQPPLQPPPQVAAPAPLPMPRPIAPPAPPAPLPLPVQKVPTLAQSGPPPTLKLKSDPPAGYTPSRKPRGDAVEDIYSARSMPPPEEQAAAFPWKLAAAAVVLVGVLAVGGRVYLTGGSEPEKTTTSTEASAPVAPPVSASSPKMGKVQVTTQPSGARVLLAGKHLGDAPLTLELPAGRHTLTFATSSDSVRRTVRVEAGKTLTLDVPIFRGWLDVAAPIILEVSENGKPIGDTEQSQLLLSPGRHELTFTNRDLDYTSTHVVEIVPGEGRRLTIDPQGIANLNATPWAEVWINGKKIGDTPLANQKLPLGTHEIVFKHPQFGERRMTTTLRANAPVALSVDMSKQ